MNCIDEKSELMIVCREGTVMYRLIRFLFALLLSLSITVPVFAQGRLIIDVKAGENFTHEKRFFLIKKITLTPQMAFWIEDETGNHIADIAVTHASAKGEWRGLGDIDRPGALPVWSHSRGIANADGGMMPKDDTVLPDAVTMASPERSFTREWPIDSSVDPGNYTIMAEVNISFDYNEPWEEDLPEGSTYYNGVNGQPSIVWRGSINIGKRPVTIDPEPVGHGSPVGANGDIVNDLDSVKDALRIVERITVTYKP